jgi:methyl halide transferase
VDWNQRYLECDTPWDKGAPHPVLDDALTRDGLAGQVLVPGCGSGHDVRALARRGLQVTGLDVAPLAIERARAFTPAGSETYRTEDLFDLPPDMRGAFDGVFEHTCFCAIDPAQRPNYVAAVASALRRGGHLLAVFYAEPDNGDEGPPFGCTPEELDGLFGGSFLQLTEHRGFPTFAHRDGRELLRLFERV